MTGGEWRGQRRTNCAAPPAHTAAHADECEERAEEAALRSRGLRRESAAGMGIAEPRANRRGSDGAASFGRGSTRRIVVHLRGLPRRAAHPRALLHAILLIVPRFTRVCTVFRCGGREVLCGVSLKVFLRGVVRLEGSEALRESAPLQHSALAHSISAAPISGDTKQQATRTGRGRREGGESTRRSPRGTRGQQSAFP